jgi:hypothetical protein
MDQAGASTEISEDDGPLSGHEWSAHGAVTPTGSESEHESGAADAPSAPIQKRRRVTRACDECRRKKIKCDGKQPCTHCSVYSYGMTPEDPILDFFSKPSSRRINGELTRCYSRRMYL